VLKLSALCQEASVRGFEAQLTSYPLPLLSHRQRNTAGCRRKDKKEGLKVKENTLPKFNLLKNSEFKLAFSSFEERKPSMQQRFEYDYYL
jgi:hypothetical protein